MLFFLFIFLLVWLFLKWFHKDKIRIIFQSPQHHIFFPPVTKELLIEVFLDGKILDPS